MLLMTRYGVTALFPVEFKLSKKRIKNFKNIEGVLFGKKYLEHFSRFPCFHGMPCRENVGARQSHKFAEFQNMF